MQSLLLAATAIVYLIGLVLVVTERGMISDGAAIGVGVVALLVSFAVLVWGVVEVAMAWRSGCRGRLVRATHQVYHAATPGQKAIGGL